MNKDEYERQLKAVGDLQRKAGWSESSIMMYAVEHRAMAGHNYDGRPLWKLDWLRITLTSGVEK